MSEQIMTENTGWRIGRSIAMELDVVLTGLHGSNWSAVFQQEFPDLIDRIPADWIRDWQVLLGKSRGIISFLEILAYLADVISEEDYQAATLAMRSLTISRVSERLEKKAQPLGIRSVSGSTEMEQVISLGSELFKRLYADLGLAFTSPDVFELENHRNLEWMCRVAKEGDLHDWFWMWLDRFYFQAYHGWRETRMDLMDHNENQAVMALGGTGKRGQAPITNWLPEQNPLVREPAYLQAVGEGRLNLLFWVEPFGLADLWFLFPGLLAVSFSKPGELYRRFLQNATDLAKRAQALADPNRLGILRIIRHFGMINTDIGKFMGISRPTVSIHAKLLREAGLIRSHEQGREMRHEIVPGELQRLFHDLESFLDLPDESDPEKT